MLWGMTSALGIRLMGLVTAKGMTSRSATTPHKRQRIHFGILGNSSRTASTASTSQLAAMLIFSNFRKMFSISLYSPKDSTSFLTSSSSSRLSAFRVVNAAINAGNEP